MLVGLEKNKMTVQNPFIYLGILVYWHLNMIADTPRYYPFTCIDKNAYKMDRHYLSILLQFLKNVIFSLHC